MTFETKSPHALETLLRDDQPEFVRLLQERDPDAFRVLVEQTQARVFSIVRRTLRNQNDADDVAQMVFVSAYNFIHTFDGRGSLLGWISRIAVNQCYTYLRSRRTQVVTAMSDLSEECADLLERSSAAADPAAPADVRIAAQEIAERLLRSLTNEERALILRKEVEGESLEEISAATGITASAAKTRIFRIRQKLLRAAAKMNHRLPGEHLGAAGTHLVYA